MAFGTATQHGQVWAASRGRIPTLDGWRAVAVLLVIASHCDLMLAASGGRAGQVAAALVSHSGYGVDIFFALSGFLITTKLLEERARPVAAELVDFYRRRVFRILPALLCYLTALFLVAPAVPAMGVGGNELAASLLFLRNYASGSWYTGHFWSLSIEEQFYLVIPCLVLLLRPRALMVVTIGLALTSICIRAFELNHADLFQPLPQFRTENRVDALLMGALAAQLCAGGGLPAWLRTRARTWMAVLLLVSLAALLFAFDSQAVRRTVVAVGIPPLILFTAYRPGTWIGRALEWRPISQLGRMSYSLYIWQMPFLVHGPVTLGPLQRFPLALVMPFLLAAASYRWVEKPMIRLGRRLGGGHPPGSASPVVAPELVPALESI